MINNGMEFWNFMDIEIEGFLYFGLLDFNFKQYMYLITTYCYW